MRKSQRYANEWERVKAMLDALPESDEDPAVFWRAGLVRKSCRNRVTMLQQVG